MTKLQPSLVAVEALKHPRAPEQGALEFEEVVVPLTEVGLLHLVAHQSSAVVRFCNCLYNSLVRHIYIIQYGL